MSGSLHIRNGRWYTTFYINGKQIERSLKLEAKKGNQVINKRKAEEAQKKLIAEYTNNPERFNKITFAAYIEKWLERKAATVEVGTVEGYRCYCETHILPYFEHSGLKLSQVTTKDIEAYYNAKATGGRLDGKSGGLSIASIRRHKAVLNQVFQDALHDGLIKSNPCQYAKMPKSETLPPKIQNIYTYEQCQQLLDLTAGTVFHDMVLTTFLYGLRRSELMGLRWSAIDFDKGKLEINHTVTVQRSITAKDRTKNVSSNREYPLLEEIRKMLLKRRKQQEEYRQIFGNRYKDSDYVFTKEDGSNYYPSYASHRLQKIIKRYDLPPINWHGLRHSCASMLFEKGLPEKDISAWLGHSGINITMDLYTHIRPEHKRQIGESLNGMLKIKA